MKSKNCLAVNAVETGFFKGMLAGMTSVNNTDGAKRATRKVVIG